MEGDRLSSTSGWRTSFGRGRIGWCARDLPSPRLPAVDRRLLGRGFGGSRRLARRARQRLQHDLDARIVSEGHHLLDRLIAGRRRMQHVRAPVGSDVGLKRIAHEARSVERHRCRGRFDVNEKLNRRRFDSPASVFGSGRRGCRRSGRRG